MAPELMPFVIERFRQGDGSATQSSHKGLGLDLAIVKHLADLHGGEIAAASAGIGRGSSSYRYAAAGARLLSATPVM